MPPYTMTHPCPYCATALTEPICFCRGCGNPVAYKITEDELIVALNINTHLNPQTKVGRQKEE